MFEVKRHVSQNAYMHDSYFTHIQTNTHVHICMRVYIHAGIITTVKRVKDLILLVKWAHAIPLSQVAVRFVNFLYRFWKRLQMLSFPNFILNETYFISDQSMFLFWLNDLLLGRQFHFIFQIQPSVSGVAGNAAVETFLYKRTTSNKQWIGCVCWICVCTTALQEEC